MRRGRQRLRKQHRYDRYIYRSRSRSNSCQRKLNSMFLKRGLGIRPRLNSMVLMRAAGKKKQKQRGGWYFLLNNANSIRNSLRKKLSL